MMDFQLHSDVDYFELDPAAYAPALGETGMAAYRVRLGRLAVLNHEVEAITCTHAMDRKVAACGELCRFCRR